MIELIRSILRRLNIITLQEHQMAIVFDNLNAQISALNVQVDNLIASHGDTSGALAAAQAKLAAETALLTTSQAALDTCKAEEVKAQAALDASAAQIAALVAKLTAAVPVAPPVVHVP